MHQSKEEEEQWRNRGRETTFAVLESLLASSAQVGANIASGRQLKSVLSELRTFMQGSEHADRMRTCIINILIWGE